MYKDSTGWFFNDPTSIRKLLSSHVDVYKKHNMLEIGCYEGISTVFFTDEILKHPESTLTCVDPYINNDSGSNVYSTFLHNLSICKSVQKITHYRELSDDFFKKNAHIYDIIYVDGSHEPKDVYNDLVNSYNHLAPGGIIWCDDYLGGDRVSIKKAIDTWHSEHPEMEVIYKGYQIAFKHT